MFKIESYVTPILLSYVDKYVKDFKPADAQVSLWGGGVVLHNLVLKTDVLQQEVALPFTLLSGRIHELLIQVPWTKIMSEPIIVTIDTIECILSLNSLSNEDKSTSDPVSRQAQVVEAPPGYMQALVRRIVSNISVRVHHLIVKYVQDDIVLSLNVKHLSIASTGATWEPAFADIDQQQPVIRRLVVLDDLTLCLDNSDSDGKIRFYQDPLLYRCRLELRVLTKLVSANTRRASSISTQLFSKKLAWSVTSDQMLLLLRLLRERIPEKRSPESTSNVSKVTSSLPLQIHGVVSNLAEPARKESWSDWAWSWMPTWVDREGNIEEPPKPTQPTPISLTAFLDDVSLAIKLMEIEGGTRKRSRSILDIHAGFAAFKISMCRPTSLQIKLGIRTVLVKSFGKCSCGHMDINSSYDEPTIYIKNKLSNVDEAVWKWPQELIDEKIEKAHPAEEIGSSSNDDNNQSDVISEPLELLTREMGPHGSKLSVTDNTPQTKRTPNLRGSQFKSLLDFEFITSEETNKNPDNLWELMSPLIFMDYTHERSPPAVNTNPYEIPPTDFEYSDWEENCNLNVQLKPIDLRLCMGLAHRLLAIKNIFHEVQVADLGLTMRTLTVEECDALLNNLPQRRINIDLSDLRVQIHPWDHSTTDRPQKTTLMLEVILPKSSMVFTAPLYPNRVCSAAGQMPEDGGPLWRGANVHITAAMNSVQASIGSVNDETRKPFARIDLRFVTHILLHKQYFRKKRSVLFSYALKIREANISGSAPRLYAATQILTSLLKQSVSYPLRQTSLARDALHDEEFVVIDCTIEDLSLRGFITKKVRTYLCTIQSLRSTVIQSPVDDEVNQAWIFSGPDIPTNTPFIRMALQWCTETFEGSVDYLGVWSEPTAISIDPLMVSWLSYKPILKPSTESMTQIPSIRTVSSSHYLLRRRTPPSSSSRGISKSASYAEQVHVRGRSVDSSSEPSEKKEKKPAPPTKPKPTLPWWKGEGLLNLHERLKKVLINMDLGLVLVYVTTRTVSAVDCATVQLAMEQHAANNQGVVVFSGGRWAMVTSSLTKHLWHFIDHEGPTYVTPKSETDERGNSFPWKLILADISCYSLEAVGPASRDKSKLKSQLKVTHTVNPRTVLELVTSTVILSVATKSIQHKIVIKKADSQKSRPTELTIDEKKMRYFTSGNDFKPTSLKEFLRGPAVRSKDAGTQSAPTESSAPTKSEPTHKVVEGPLVSLGFHLHADTPPIVIRLEHDQVRLIAMTLHCISHVVSLLKRNPMDIRKRKQGPFDFIGPSKSVNRSISEVDELSLSEDNRSENQSDLLTIYDTHQQEETSSIKTFFWFQWVVSRATVVVSTNEVKLAFDMDDMISTIDLQEHYNQLKVKMASATIKQYERTVSGQWTVGALGGRVLEAVEPVDSKENHFLAVTITQARISNLPASWKEELHPKLLEQQTATDSMWEIYAVLAPLDVVVLPAILDNVMSVVNSISSRSYCPIPNFEERRISVDMPFCYLTAGGLKLIFACDLTQKELDDTFILSIGKVSLNPHPDNPICRRAVAAGETAWQSVTGNLDGRQYEVFVKGVSVRSARFSQLVSQEASATEAQKGVTSENPAVKWGQTIAAPILTPVLHSLDVSFILAPALFVGGILVSGPAIEFNLNSDCHIEFSTDHLNLAMVLINKLRSAVKRRMTVDPEVYGEATCPYLSILAQQRVLEPSPKNSEIIVNEVAFEKSEKEIGSTVTPTMDSGVDTATSRSTLKSSQNLETPLKKSYSVTFMEQAFDASDHLEIFITIGVIEVSLYTVDDGSSELESFKPEVLPGGLQTPDEPERPHNGSRSLTETIRNADIGMSQIRGTVNMARKGKGNIPLLHAVLYQPNLYYWKRRFNKSLQMSLFNIWLGFGAGIMQNCWHAPLISTARGVPDPVTEIPPALLTLKYTSSSVGSGMFTSSSVNSKVNLNLDIERPVLVELTEDSFRRIFGIRNLIKTKLSHSNRPADMGITKLPFLYRLRRFMGHNAIDAATVQMSQFAVTGFDTVAGWDSASLQISWNARPERLVVRGLINALLVSTGPFNEYRTPILHPLELGFQMEAIWEAWRRAEGGLTAKEPIVRCGIELDQVIFDIRPEDLSGLFEVLETLKNMQQKPDEKVPASTNEDSLNKKNSDVEHQLSNPKLESRPRISVSSEICGTGHHYYKDDLRSGAFKIVSGGQLPMAYQVTLHLNIVSWRYPHPRAITRLIAFPLPDQDTETDGVLEFYNRIMNKWVPHTFVKLPVNEPREISLQIKPPDTIFATTWRFRITSDDEVKLPYEFNMAKFQPRPDPVVDDQVPDIETTSSIDITAEQLSGVLRVDSYFAPYLTPKTSLCLRFVKMEVNVHNATPPINGQVSGLEGYYVSRPLMRSHRVLSLTAKETAVHAEYNPVAGALFLIEAELSSDILNCTTGSLERLVNGLKVQGGLSIPAGLLELSRMRLCTSNIHVVLHVPRLRTLTSLLDDWKSEFAKCVQSEECQKVQKVNSKIEIAAQAANLLEGRVSLWIHNHCSVAIRVGQENTDEIVPLSPGSRLAYRWRNSTSKKRIRFALASPHVDWHWSNSIPFQLGSCRVRLETLDTSEHNSSHSGDCVYVNVKQVGAHRIMQLSGRLIIANMLRFNIFYKVRIRTDKNQWQTLSTEDLGGETTSHSIVCSSNQEMVLKIRLANHETGWSGDIPLKECPKENVPWLVKVPSEGEIPYMSVWCRVLRARSDGRVVATIWPLFVLRSELTLDTDVLLATDVDTVVLNSTSESVKPAPLIQTAPGRGTCTHLLAPGTTSARHSLSFQYRDLECPVTKDAVPLHYGVTDVSVFDKRVPMNTVEEILKELKNWLDKSGRNVVSSWPYSIVTKHWPGQWQPALLQPRCEVVVRYQAVKVGGGCSLEVLLYPTVIMCNASPIVLTLRAHDAAPMCKLEPGNAISPPSIVLKNPFFMSIEMGRETFVSNQLEIYSKEPGRYGSPPPGQVAVDYPVTFAIQCNQKVTLLNLHYELKDEKCVLGITSAFLFINNLSSDLLVSAIVVPAEAGRDFVLQPKTFKVVKPTKSDSIEGTPIYRFWLRDRWRGGEVSELQPFISVALPDGSNPAHAPVPIRLGIGPTRKPFSLNDSSKKSIPVVVTQHKHEGRWIVSISKDPCPQFVVHNFTKAEIAIGQPETEYDDSSNTPVMVIPDCVGVHWWCSLMPGSITHYSTPGYCVINPPPPDIPSPVPFLAFAITNDNGDPIWCPPVAAADGEQLVQLTRNVTVKLRVRTYPHSTLVELKDIDHNDISASDIRRRLTEQFPSKANLSEKSTNIKRVGADEKLLSTYRNTADKYDKNMLIQRENLVRSAEMGLEELKKLNNADSKLVKSSSDTKVPMFLESKTYQKLDAADALMRQKIKNLVSDGVEAKEIEVESLDKKLQDIAKSVSADILESELSGRLLMKCASEDTPSVTEKTLAINEPVEEVEIPANQSETASTVTKQSILVSKEPVTLFQSSGCTGNMVTILKEDIDNTVSAVTIARPSSFVSEMSGAMYQDSNDSANWEQNMLVESERLRCMFAGIIIEMSSVSDVQPLMALHVDRVAVILSTYSKKKKIKSRISVADIQIDNLQYENGQFDFAVIATTRAEALVQDTWPALWNIFSDKKTFSIRKETARLVLKTCHDKWTVGSDEYSELTELEIQAGPLALYIEDAYITALAELLRLAMPPHNDSDESTALAEARTLQNPLRLRLLYIHPLDLTLTLHTAVRMYIALDQSPLHLSAFRLQNMFTSTERLAHALTVHYLSAAILGAGWVVGGLELLGAPGALAARVGGATGGVRGIASAAAAALLRSLSAWAGSLARNLDLLAGDEEHARRAAAARRRPHDSFVAGLLAGITNFAINILGAVGGLAHHPLVGVAVGETDSSAAALRRGLLGALTKPLSATADLVAYAGHGLLKQTGWDPVPQPRPLHALSEATRSGWCRDCVRWTFRLAELSILGGYEVQIDTNPAQLILTHKFLMIAEPETERVLQMIDLRYCTMGEYQGSLIELSVKQRRPSKVPDVRGADDDEDYQVSTEAMARVARYTGTEGTGVDEAHILKLLPNPGQSHALYAALCSIIHHNADTHFSLL